jgi:hypothetical protein
LEVDDVFEVVGFEGEGGLVYLEVVYDYVAGVYG